MSLESFHNPFEHSLMLCIQSMPSESDRFARSLQVQTAGHRAFTFLQGPHSSTFIHTRSPVVHHPDDNQSHIGYPIKFIGNFHCNCRNTSLARISSPCDATPRTASLSSSSPFLCHCCNSHFHYRSCIHELGAFIELHSKVVHETYMGWERFEGRLGIVILGNPSDVLQRWVLPST